MCRLEDNGPFDNITFEHNIELLPVLPDNPKEATLIFRHCHFEKNVSFPYGQKAYKKVSFINCHFHEGLQSPKDIIPCEVLFEDCTFDSNGHQSVHLSHSQFKGSLIFIRCAFYQIFLAERINVAHHLSFISCRFLDEGELEFSELDLYLHQRFSCNEKPEITCLNLSYAKIGHHLLFDSEYSDALIISNEQYLCPRQYNLIQGSMDLSKILVGGNFYLTRSCCLGSLIMSGSCIEGEVNIGHSDSVQLTGPHQSLLLIDGALFIDFSEFHRHLKISHTETRCLLLEGSHISEKAELFVLNILQKTTLVNALFKSSLKIGQSSFKGNIDAARCTIAVDFNVFDMKLAKDFILTNAQIHGNVDFDSVLIEGQFNITGTHANQIELKNIQVEGDLKFSKCTITSDVKIEASKTHTSSRNYVCGNMNFTAATIFGSVYLRHLIVGNKLDFSRVKIINKLAFDPHVFKSKETSSRWTYVKTGSLILSGAEIAFIFSHGITVEKELMIYTGEFRRVRFYPGISIFQSPSEQGDNKYSVKFINTKIGIIDINCIEVLNSIEFGHLDVTYITHPENTSENLEKKYHTPPNRINLIPKSGFNFSHSTVGAALRVHAPTQIRELYYFYKVNVPSFTNNQTTKFLDFKDWEKPVIESRIIGSISIVSNKIDGSIDLRNTSVERTPQGYGGKIDLSDNTINGDIHMCNDHHQPGLGSETSSEQSFRTTATKCEALVLDNTVCNGDVELYGLDIQPPKDREKNPSTHNVVISAVGLKASGNLYFIRAIGENQFKSIILREGEIRLSGIDTHKLSLNALELNNHQTPDCSNTNEHKVVINLEHSTVKNLAVFLNPLIPTGDEKNHLRYSLFGTRVSEWSAYHCTEIEHKEHDYYEANIDPRNSMRNIDFYNILKQTDKYEHNSWNEVESFLYKKGRYNDAEFIRHKANIDELERGESSNSSIDVRISSVFRLFFSELLYNTGRGILIPVFLFLFFLYNWHYLSSPFQVAPSLPLYNLIEKKISLDPDAKNHFAGRNYTYEVLCNNEHKQTFGFMICDGLWNSTDSFKTTLYYHVPMIDLLYEPSWKPRKTTEGKDLVLGFPITPEKWMLFSSILCWILLPTYLYGITLRLMRRNKVFS